MKWHILICLLMTGKAITKYVFTRETASQCKEAIMNEERWQPAKEMFSKDRRQYKLAPDVRFEMHFALQGEKSWIIVSNNNEKKITSSETVKFQLVLWSTGQGAMYFYLNSKVQVACKKPTTISLVELRPFYLRIRKNGRVQFGRECEEPMIDHTYSDNGAEVNKMKYFFYMGINSRILYDCPVDCPVFPEIAKSESYLKKKEGSKVDLPCRIQKGNPKPSITWLFMKKGTTGYVQMNGKTGEVLQLTKVLVDNEGHYKCEAKNTEGRAEHIVQLEVEAPPGIIKSESYLKKKEGSKVDLPCRIQKGNPKPSITWFFMKKGTSGYVQMNGKTGEVLQLTNVLVDNEGHYKCEAKNTEGRAEHIVQLEVETAPEIQDSDPYLWHVEGSTVDVPCRIQKGNPKPSITWFFMKKGTSGYVQMKDKTDEVLHLTNVLKGNQGHYKCVAQNTEGRAEHIVELEVEKIVVCYYGTWATYRSGVGKFDVTDIDTTLCTHLVYSFVGIGNGGNLTSLDPYLDLPDNYGLDNFRKFNALKQENTKLKTLLAVGGWNEGSAKYSNMAASSTLRQNFVTSAAAMVQQYGFDGLDIDWEYPNQRDSTHGELDVNNFSTLLKELRAEFDKHGLMITVAVAAVKSSASLSYDIPTISQYLDYVHLMTYDMYGAWDSVTGHNAPLHKGEGQENLAKESVFSVDVTLDYWLTQGCPPEKLVLGLPMYGRTFTLTNANVNGVGALSSGAGLAGLYTATNGLIGYNEFCYKLSTETWDIRYDSLAEVPYAVQTKNWVSYDNPDSLTKKVEYAMNLGIAGAMAWSIETDDFHGSCGEVFSLLKAINKALEGNGTSSTTSTTSTSTSTTTQRASTSTSTSSATSTTTPRSTTTTAKTTVTTESSSICVKEGVTANPADCSTFFICVYRGDGTLSPTLFNCPGALLWDDTALTCNYASSVDCKT